MMKYRFAILILLITAIMSSLVLNQAQRWHPDEAFYMTIARNAAIKGDWMLIDEPLDKPPLTYYANALSLVFFAIEPDADGVLHLDPYKGEFAGRLFAFWTSILLVAVILKFNFSALANDNHAALIAGLLAALSPLRIVFAPTAFTDMPLLFFATLSLWMAFRKKWAWSGLWFVISLSAKPQSIFFLPLILFFLVLSPSPLNPLSHKGRGDLSFVWGSFIARFFFKEHDNLSKRSQTHIGRIVTPSLMLRGGDAKRSDAGVGLMIRNFLRFITPIIIGAILLYLWDMARVNLGATSFLALGQAYYTPIQITPLSDYPARISDLWQTIQYLFGHGIITGALLIFGIIQTIRRGKMIAWIFMLWIIGFVGLHIVLTLNLFDRNLLLIVPIACLWIGHSIASINWRLGIILAIMIVPFSLISTTGHYPIGGDDGRHTGIDDLADYLNSKPIATVIYDRWLDWELDYYMGEWTNKRRVYFPSPLALTEGALELEEIGMRYFAAPVEEDISDWLLALTNAGFSVSTDYESENFRVFVIVPP